MTKVTNESVRLASEDIQVLKPRGSVFSDADIELYKQNVVKYTREYYANQVIENHQEECFRFIEELNLKSFDVSDFVTPMWQEHIDKIEKEFYSEPFLLMTHELVRYAMYCSTANAFVSSKLPFLKSYYCSSSLSFLLKEEDSFLHTIAEPQFNSTESRLMHLSHLTYAESKLNFEFSSASLIVEFGGGYGGMTALLRKLNSQNTIVVIDLPAMLNVQIYYLFPNFKDDIHVLTCETDVIVEGKINLCPINLAKTISIRQPDLFIATWSLSEANNYTQQLMVDELNMFQAKNILYGYRKYVDVNPRQPCSKALELGQNYRVVENKATFWTLDNENNYFLAERL